MYYFKSLIQRHRRKIKKYSDSIILQYEKLSTHSTMTESCNFLYFYNDCNNRHIKKKVCSDGYVFKRKNLNPYLALFFPQLNLSLKSSSTSPLPVSTIDKMWGKLLVLSIEILTCSLVESIEMYSLKINKQNI